MYYKTQIEKKLNKNSCTQGQVGGDLMAIPYHLLALKVRRAVKYLDNLMRTNTCQFQVLDYCLKYKYKQVAKNDKKIKFKLKQSKKLPQNFLQLRSTLWTLKGSSWNSGLHHCLVPMRPEFKSHSRKRYKCVIE